MSELNVEKIMEEIRSEIKARGYTSDMLSFNDVTSEEVGISAEKFDWVKFKEELFNLNTVWNVNPYREIERKTGLKGRCVAFFKKVICKCIRFYVAPIVLEQDTFNATVVRMINMLNLFVEENIRLSGEIERLEGEQEKLRNEVRQFRDRPVQRGEV